MDFIDSFKNAFKNCQERKNLTDEIYFNFHLLTFQTLVDAVVLPCSSLTALDLQLKPSFLQFILKETTSPEVLRTVLSPTDIAFTSLTHLSLDLCGSVKGTPLSMTNPSISFTTLGIVNFSPTMIDVPL